MAEETARTVGVLVPVPVDRAYSYGVPDGMELAPGDIVRVPLGSRSIITAVWEADGEPVSTARLRFVEEKYDAPPLAEAMRAFVDWVADYTLSSPGMVLRMVLRAPDALMPEGLATAYRLAGPPPERMTTARSRVLEMLADGLAWPKRALAAAAGVSPSVIEGLVTAGTVEAVGVTPKPVVAAPDAQFRPPELSTDQRAAADALCAAAGTATFSVSLLDGVTGAGKTEVYFEAIADVLEAGRAVLILLPEISLTAQFLDRFEERFGARPAEWHSQMTPKTRERVWRGVQRGTIKAVAGARSALFLPFPDLGLIVVDEEHDAAYKQDDRVTYHARDMAVVRGHIGGFPVILSSATPSVESRLNAERGRYAHVLLPDRYAGALPAIETIDMRAHKPGRDRWLAKPLVESVRDAVDAGQQALLFLNRRGYAPLTLCSSCGFRFECRDCSASLVEHRFRRQLLCHHCGHVEERPRACPECGEKDTLVPCGPGVERIADETRSLFPEARIAILSSDLVPGIALLRERLDMIARGEADIIVGTQLVAKGHHFPGLALAAIVDADLGLATADPRAGERTFQLLQQVTGRAGRTREGGRGLIQTYQPEHPVMQAIVSGDREAFYTREFEQRHLAGMPPFGRLAAIIVSGKDRDQTADYARALSRAAPQHATIRVLGPAEAPLAILRGRFRHRFLVKAPRSADIQQFLRAWITAAPAPRGSLRAVVDIDPVSFM